MTYRLGIIGCGNMGEALLKGIIDSDAVGLEEIIIYDKDSDRRSYLKSQYSINLSDNLKDTLDSENILLAIKPQNLHEFIEQVKEIKLEGKNIISILAGIPTGYFEKKLGRLSVIRIMPNTPALVKQGMLVISRGEYASQRDLDFARMITSNLGEAVVVEEKFQNLATALSGSGPAYYFLFCKCLIDAAEKKGMDRQVAKKLVVETMAGSAALIKESGRELGQLIAMVTSPGGTTEKALEQFRAWNIEEMVRSAIESAIGRAHELERLQDSEE